VNGQHGPSRRPRWGDGLAGTGRETPATAGYAPPLALRRPAPHTMFNVVFQGIFQAWALNRAFRAIVAGNFHSYPITREEDLGWQVPAPPLHHPGRFQLGLPKPYASLG
jgi:hypothetical protein